MSTLRFFSTVVLLLLYIERSQLRWLKHQVYMPPWRCVLGMLHQKGPCGRPRTCRRNHFYKVAWQSLEIPPDEMEELSGVREV